jgi:hypothetical protein
MPPSLPSEALLQQILNELRIARTGGTPRITSLGSTIASGTTPSPDNIPGLNKEIAELNKEIEKAKIEFTDLFDHIAKHQEVTSKKIEIAMKEAAIDFHNAALTVDEYNQKIKELNQNLKALAEETRASNNIDRLGQSLLKTGIKSGGLSEKMIHLGKSFAKVKAEGGSVGKSLLHGFTAIGLSIPTKLLSLYIEQTFELAKAQDAAISSFRKATGATKEYNIAITQAERRNFAAGVEAKDASAAFENLFTSFSAFTQLNVNQQAAIADTTVLLNKLGVSGGTASQILDKAMRATGMSAGQANDILLDLAGSAQSLGVPINKMADDFAGAFGDLTKYGDKTIDIFKSLEIQAKNTGISVSALIGIAKQFDTFDGAGKAVGRLNAILGGPYLNSIDMLNSSEEERIDILKRQVDMAGVNFNSLQRFEKQALASAVNMSVEDAQRLFNMSDTQYKLDSMKQKDLQKLATETQEIGQQLKSAFMALAVDLRPLVEKVIVPMVHGMSKFAMWVGESTNAVGQLGRALLPVVAMVALLLAPVTGGASLVVALGALAGIAGIVGYGATVKGTNKSSAIVPHFADGGVTGGSSVSMVGERGPELVEMPVGSRVTTAPATKLLTDAIAKLTNKLDSMGGNGNIQLAVYIGQEKIDEVVVKSLNSFGTKNLLGPYTNS